MTETIYREEVYKDQEGRTIVRLVPVSWPGLTDGTQPPPDQFRGRYQIHLVTENGMQNTISKEIPIPDVLTVAEALAGLEAAAKQDMETMQSAAPRILRPSGGPPPMYPGKRPFPLDLGGGARRNGR